MDLIPVPHARTHSALAAGVEQNAAEWVRLQGCLPWVEWHDDGDAQWVFAGDRWPRNSVALARFDPKVAYPRVGQILAYHLEKRVACNWVIGPATEPPTLHEHLRAHGFRCMMHCAAMACDLGRIRPVSIPRHVRIRLTETAPALQRLTTERRRLRQQGKTMMAQFSPKQVWHFAAHVNDQTVGETTLCVGAGLAGLFDVEVLEPFRGRGIGTALVHAAVSHARSLGFSTAGLGATGMGSRVYHRVGFQTVGRLSFWKYGKTKAGG